MSIIIAFFQLLIFIVLSFLLIHILAFLGIFVAMAYPIWWLFSPKTVPCLLCRTGQVGDTCVFCDEPITDENYINPKNFGSVFLNVATILFLSIMSFGLVYVESRILNYFGFSPVKKTVSFVIPSEGEYRVGEVFPMKIELHGIRQPINAVQADFSFDPSMIEVIDISTEGSFANIFVQKKIDNEIGYGRLSGGLPNPGFFAEYGLFGTVLLRGKTAGVSNIEFLPSSLILANDI